jgi:sulfite exporter TauE/SafE
MAGEGSLVSQGIRILYGRYHHSLMLFSGFLIGLVGGMHCIIMCSPVVLALNPRNNWWSQLRYQTGRIGMYVVLGIIVGFIGSGFSFFGLSRVISIAMGVLMIVLTLWPVTRNKLYSISVSKGPVAYFRRMLSRAGWGKPVLAGMVNGLLPCGLVYVALTGSLALGSITSASVFMLGFGLGTVPWLSGAVMTVGFIPDQFRKKAAVAIPALAVMVGVLFILRGLALDIPYISPALQAIGLPEEMTMCGEP